MSLFRRCQRFQPLIANACRPQFGSTSYFMQQTRNGGGGHGGGFPRSAWDHTVEKEPPKFPKNAYDINTNEPTDFFLFLRTNLSHKEGPNKINEIDILFGFLMVCYVYGLYTHSKYNPHH